MFLTKVTYSEIHDSTSENSWELVDLRLKKLNLIVGKNASGKSKTLQLIDTFSLLIMDQYPISTGIFDIEWEENGETFSYKLSSLPKKVISESLLINNEPKLKRSHGKTEICSETNGWQNISPPDDKLVLHVRRDTKEYPFFEKLSSWAKGVVWLKFANANPSAITIPQTTSNIPQSTLLNSRPWKGDLNTLPYILKDLMELNGLTLNKVVNDFNKLGYLLENISINQFIIPGQQPAFIASFKEQGLKFPVLQSALSQGMFRSFALIAALNRFVTTEKDQQKTIIIDDLCEGLDYERSTELTKFVFEQLNQENIQLIASSNDQFLINAVDMGYWNMLKRTGYRVEAINSVNNKKLFEEFTFKGLNNFDFFSSN